VHRIGAEARFIAVDPVAMTVHPATNRLFENVFFTVV
jgi:hypothetical protein